MSRCTLVVTGAPLAGRAVAIVRALQAETELELDFLLSEPAATWLSETDMVEAGVPARSKIVPRAPMPDVVVVCPATFNTVNKLAAGIADTRVLSFLSECLGAQTKMILAPMINDRLWNHPALHRNLEALASAGCQLVDVRTLTPPAFAVSSGTGDAVTAKFDVVALAKLVKAAAA